MVANVIANRVIMTTTTTGTGTYTLGTAVTGYLTADLSGVATGSRVPYLVVDSLTAPTKFEVGEGVYTLSGLTLTRATIRENTAGGATAENWSAGTKYVVFTPNAANLAILNDIKALAISATSAGTVFTAGASGMGNALTVTSGAGGNTLDAESPNSVLAANEFKMNRIRFNTPSISLTGAATWPKPTLYQHNLSGTYSGDLGGSYIHNFIINADTAALAVENPGHTGVAQFVHRFGGGAMSGSRRGVSIQQVQEGVVAPLGSTSFEGLAVHAFLTASMGGTGWGSDSDGNWYGHSVNVTLKETATYLNVVNGWGEMNFAVHNTASVRQLLGRATYAFGSHRKAGQELNVVDSIANQGPTFDPEYKGATATWEHGHTYGREAGQWAMTGTSFLYGAVYQTSNGNAGKDHKFPPNLADYGVKLGYVNFSLQSGCFLEGPGLSVDGVGAIKSQNLRISHTATGVDIDIPYANRVISVTPSTPGTGSAGLGNYHTGDILYSEVTSGVRAQYLVDTTQMLNATVVTGGSGGTNGVQTFTTTTGTGTQAQFTGTVTGGVLSGALTPTVAGSFTANPVTRKVLTATVKAGGSDGTPDGAVTITGTTGTSGGAGRFTATGTITGGVLTGALSVVWAGNYSVTPTDIYNEPVAGGSLSGATVELTFGLAAEIVSGGGFSAPNQPTVSLGIGVLTASPLVPDVSNSTPATITPEAGSGAGAVLTPTWSTRRMIRLATTGYEVAIGGPLLTYQPAPTAKTDHVTLTAAEIMTRRIEGTPTANANYTFPTATNLAAAIPGIAVNDMFILNVENAAISFQITMLANTGITIPAATDPVIYPQSGGLGPSARSFGLRYTGTNAFSLYGL